VSAVVGGNIHADAPGSGVGGFHLGSHLLGRSEDRRHGARFGRRQQRAARFGKAHAILQAEHARRLRGRQFADAVTQHNGRPNTDTCPERRERALQRIERRLLPCRIGKIPLRAVPAEHQIQQGSAPLLDEYRLATVEYRPRNRFALVKRQPHPGPLAPLARVGERNRGRFARSRPLFTPGHLLQSRAQGFRVPKNDAFANIEVASSRARGPGHVGKQRIRGRAVCRKFAFPPRKPVQVARRQFPKRGGRLGGERQKTRAARGGLPFRGRQVRNPFRHRNGNRLCGAGYIGYALNRSALTVRAPVFFHHKVSVGAGNPEGVHARQARPASIAGPVQHFGRDLERQTVPVDSGVGVPQMQVFRYHALIHDQYGLDQSRHARCRFQVTHVGLHRTDQQRIVGLARPAVDGGHGVDFDRVANGGPGSMRFQVIHFHGLDACLRQGFFDHPFQRRRVGDGQADAGAPVVYGGAPDDGPDPVAVRLRFAQPLQNNDPASLSANITVGRSVEGLALPLGGQHHRVGAQFVNPAVQDRLHPARNRQVGLALLQVRHRVMYRHQR